MIVSPTVPRVTARAAILARAVDMLFCDWLSER
jgi:hypothetical protein